MTDLSTIPLVALSIKSKCVISTLLNPTKYLPCDNGLPRDWRGLAHLSNLEGKLMSLLASNPDPTAYILSFLEQSAKKVTIKDLQTLLENIDRWDIIDDTQTLIEDDAVKYLECLKNSQISATEVENKRDAQVLTIDDLYRERQGLESQYYDAFILYADEDAAFANEMIENLEKYNIKLCIKDRDLIGGMTFEYEAVMQLISDRCNRLIVIVSPDFLKSSANKFFLNYAQAVGIDKRQRKIVPCLYKKCVLPPQLNYMSILDYNRVGMYDFWGRLRNSIQVPNVLQSENIKTTSSLMSTKDDILLESVQTDYLPLLDTKTDISESLEVSKNVCKSTTHKNLSKNPNKSKNSCETNKKHMKLLEWTKKKLNRKVKAEEPSYEFNTEKVILDNLPSLDNLDTLSSVLNSTSVTEKQSEQVATKSTLSKKFLIKA